ncbi:MAG TPA: hypothetical protein VM099_00015 [Gemmatimonadaceae bacterium]|nr:hypothetical protein [Gemmatimonadaceae bacterium]
MSRIEFALSESLSAPLTDSLIDAAARNLAEIAHSKGANERGAAFDLLAADALITYAVEGAIEDPPTFTEKTDAMIKRVAEISSS